MVTLSPKQQQRQDDGLGTVRTEIASKVILRMMTLTMDRTAKVAEEAEAATKAEEAATKA